MGINACCPRPQRRARVERLVLDENVMKALIVIRGSAESRVLEEREGDDVRDAELVPEQEGVRTQEVLEAVERGEGPSRMLVTLGYAGWSPGQLEHELSQNAWLTVEAADSIIFETPAEERLPAAMQLLGIDFARLQDEAGHA